LRSSCLWHVLLSLLLPRSVLLLRHSFSILLLSTLFCYPLLAPFTRRITDIIIFITDVKDVKYVINYDFPTNVEDYVHRVGRTGRGGKTGESITFFTTENAKQAKELVSILTEAKQEIDPRLLDMVRMGSGGGNRKRYGGGGPRGGGNRYGGRGGGYGGGGYGGGGPGRW
jgi:ATP-dependent RNA helicase DDX5/DBP2